MEKKEKKKGSPSGGREIFPPKGGGGGFRKVRRDIFHRGTIVFELSQGKNLFICYSRTAGGGENLCSYS